MITVKGISKFFTLILMYISKREQRCIDAAKKEVTKAVAKREAAYQEAVRAKAAIVNIEKIFVQPTE